MSARLRSIPGATGERRAAGGSERMAALLRGASRRALGLALCPGGGSAAVAVAGQAPAGSPLALSCAGDRSLVPSFGGIALLTPSISAPLALPESAFGRDERAALGSGARNASNPPVVKKLRVLKKFLRRCQMQRLRPGALVRVPNSLFLRDMTRDDESEAPLDQPDLVFRVMYRTSRCGSSKHSSYVYIQPEIDGIWLDDPVETLIYRWVGTHRVVRTLTLKWLGLDFYPILSAPESAARLDVRQIAFYKLKNYLGSPNERELVYRVNDVAAAYREHSQSGGFPGCNGEGFRKETIFTMGLFASFPVRDLYANTFRY